ncbi:UV-B-induced protein At3g17800, chloroplastic-like [Primulina eburnea]|uniref:UV-B-induced protein At3g17800, chloroplastic-like n=1 Tax=Primulina eburnea TaxID=1245227 RepID=UPI003C6BF0C6
MESVAALQCSCSNVSFKLCDSVARSLLNRVESKPMLGRSWIQQRQWISRMKCGNRKLGFMNKKVNSIRASMQPSMSDSSHGPVAPLQMESPVGQFLCQILRNHPHLVVAAAEHQLKQFQFDRESERDKEEPSTSGTELVLYRRIAEVKSNERKKAVEEILYALVVQKFMDANVPLIPSITQLSPNHTGQVDTCPSQEEKLEHLHSAEAYEMIQNHLVLVLGNRLGDSDSIVQQSKLRIGQLYAASVMYGYFLKRIDKRFQLEKTMRILPQGIDDEEINRQEVITEEMKPGGTSRDESFGNSQTHSEMSSWDGGAGARGFSGIKPSRLRTYVMSYDGETLQRYATIRSKEAVSIIERHTQALFGSPEIVISPQESIDSSQDELIEISIGGLRRLVLEAVTFGSFLWVIESYIDSMYHFVAN